MGKKVAIVQSNYIPWRGYFDLIRRVDEFILFDDMQYTRRDWRNRNKIKTPQGAAWLSIPVMVKGRYFQKINETLISEPSWVENHWKTICQCYAKAPFFKQYAACFEELYLDCKETLLSRINFRFISAINKILDIQTKISWSSDYGVIDGKTERLVDLCKKTDAAAYLSGPSARGYIAEDLFAEAHIDLQYMDYSGYMEYPQLYPPFDHAVSIIDLIFNTGEKACSYMKETK